MIDLCQISDKVLVGINYECDLMTYNRRDVSE